MSESPSLKRSIRTLVLLKAIEMHGRGDLGETTSRIVGSVIDEMLQEIAADPFDDIYAGNYDSWPRNSRKHL